MMVDVYLRMGQAYQNEMQIAATESACVKAIDISAILAEKDGISNLDDLECENLVNALSSIV